jgi:hypothetical protein
MEMEEDSTLGCTEMSSEDEKIQERKHNIKEEKLPGFTEDHQGVL